MSRRVLDDIRRYPFVGGEWIKTYDTDGVSTKDYNLIVEEVSGDPKTCQILKCKVTSNGHPEHKPGKEMTISLDVNGDPFYGMIVPQGAEDPSDKLTRQTEVQIIQYTLIGILKMLDLQGHKARTPWLLSQLQEQNILPASKDYYDKNRGHGLEKGPDFKEGARLLKKCIDLRTDGVLKYTQGGWIVYQPNAAAAAAKDVGGIVKKSNANPRKKIVRTKFIEGIIALAESGILGEIEWV